MSEPSWINQKQFIQDVKFTFHLIARLLIFCTDLAQTHIFWDNVYIARYYIYRCFIKRAWLKKKRARRLEALFLALILFANNATVVCFGAAQQTQTPETRAKIRARALVIPPPSGSLTGASFIKQGERAIHPWVKLSIRRDATNVAYWSS